MANLTNSSKLIEKIESLEPIEYNAWQWISIGDASINARKWPCPDWRHIPSVSEWNFIETVLFNLWVVKREYSSGWRRNAIRYLHIPMAWYREDTWIGNDGLSIELRAADWYVDFWDISDEEDADIWAGSGINRSTAWWIRPFKDIYETPTSSWTVVVWSFWSNWVFYNQTEWLISVSNWQTWYTMSDKNLWATVVYNNWDTISEANSWYFYQFWNNYWFPWVWNSSTVNVSNTAVDITWYWPNNYYNNDTFVWIPAPGSISTQRWIWDWSDLWWGVSWIITQENVISNTWVLSVNGQTGNVTIASPDMSNYLAKNNTTAFIPSGDYNPSTKKYVDDKSATVMTESEYSQVSNPVTGKIYFIKES